MPGSVPGWMGRQNSRIAVIFQPAPCHHSLPYPLLLFRDSLCRLHLPALSSAPLLLLTSPHFPGFHSLGCLEQVVCLGMIFHLHQWHICCPCWCLLLATHLQYPCWARISWRWVVCADPAGCCAPVVFLQSVLSCKECRAGNTQE